MPFQVAITQTKMCSGDIRCSQLMWMEGVGHLFGKNYSTLFELAMGFQETSTKINCTPKFTLLYFLRELTIIPYKRRKRAKRIHRTFNRFTFDNFKDIEPIMPPSEWAGSCTTLWTNKTDIYILTTGKLYSIPPNYSLMKAQFASFELNPNSFSKQISMDLRFPHRWVDFCMLAL